MPKIAKPELLIEFYKSKTDEKPADAYPNFSDDKFLAYAAYNWLQMHKGGKVVVTELPDHAKASQ